MRVLSTALLFCLIGFALYGHVLPGEFVSDDYPYIVENLAVRNLSDLSGLWRSFPTRFLVMVSFAANFSLHRLDTFGYHLVNILIHIINALLVAALTRLTFLMPALKNNRLAARAPSVAFYAGLIFLCHPIQTQGVAYITQRATSLAVLFYVLAVVFYAWARINQRFVFFVLSWISMLLGAFCKEMLTTVPLVLLVYEAYFGKDFRSRWKERLRMIAPHGAVAVLVVLVFLSDRPGSVLGLKGQLAGGGFDWRYFVTEINVLRTYLRLLFIPVNQIHHYAYHFHESLFEPASLGSFLLLAGMLAAALKIRRRERLISFTIIWFFITTAVEFWVVCFVKRGVLYEHWLYLPMVGFALFLSVLLHRVINRPALAKTALIFILAVYSVLTIMRNFVWQTEIGFWEDVVRKSPDTPLIYLGSGTAYQRRGRWGDAYLHYQKGLHLFARRKKTVKENDLIYLSSIYNNLGLIYEKQGLREAAVRAYQKAYRYDATNPSPYRNLANICLRTKKFRQALFLLNEEKKYSPHDPEIYYGFGLAFWGLGQTAQGQASLSRAEYLYRHYGDAIRADQIRSLLERVAAGEKP